MKLTISIGLILILLAMNVTALGVSPARSYINFQPNLNETKSLTIYNNDYQDLKLLIEVEGPLKSYFDIPSTIYIPKNQATKKLAYTISLPKFLNAGEHISKIKITAPPTQTDQTINSQLIIKHRVIVKVDGTTKKFFTGYATLTDFSKVPKIIPEQFIPKRIKESENSESNIGLTNLVALFIIALLLVIILILVIKQPQHIKQAKNYIKQAKGQGHTEEEIRQAAIKAGWPEEITQKLFKK